VVIPLTTLLFVFGGYTAGGVQTALFFGLAGIIWSFILVLIATAINRTKKFQVWLANWILLAAASLLFFTLGAGVLTYMLMGGAIASMPEWLHTITGGPLAEIDIMFYIIFNSVLEAIVIPMAVLVNWDNAKRRKLVLTAALVFYGVRVWTYMYFAPEYFNYESITQTAQLADILTTRMRLDYLRIALNIFQAVLFYSAALIPFNRNAETTT
jgi:hypothetical protein